MKLLMMVIMIHSTFVFFLSAAPFDCRDNFYPQEVTLLALYQLSCSLGHTNQVTFLKQNKPWQTYDRLLCNDIILLQTDTPHNNIFSVSNKYKFKGMTRFLCILCVFLQAGCLNITFINIQYK